MSEFTPVLYMKRSCPFCLKLASFLAEAGIWGRFEVRAFFDGDENEQPIRDELAPYFEKVSFPTLQYAPGEYMGHSSDIIAKYAAELGLDPQNMPFVNYVLEGPFRRMGNDFRTIRELTAKLESAEA